MNREDVTTSISRGLANGSGNGGASWGTILVPVDSSGNSYNALAYALNLARSWNARIHLLYVIDIDEIPETESNFTIARVIDRLEARASVCLESLKEIIEESGVRVVVAETEIGRVIPSLRKKIDATSPDLTVASQVMLTDIPSDIQCPILSIPEVTLPQLPKSAMLLCDQVTFSPQRIEPVINFVKRKFLEPDAIFIFHRETERRTFQHWLPGQEISTPVYFYSLKNAETIKSARKLIQAHNSDLLCLVLKEQFFITKLFNRQFPLRMVRSLDVPVLIIRASQKFPQ